MPQRLTRRLQAFGTGTVGTRGAFAGDFRRDKFRLYIKKGGAFCDERTTFIFEEQIVWLRR